MIEAARSHGMHRASTADCTQILKDLPRTFCDRPEVARSSAIIESVLMEYAAVDPDVGYCQGMNCVAAVVSTQFPDPTEAFTHFNAIVRGIRGLWLPGFPLFLTGMDAFEALYRKRLPELYSHFNEQSLTFDMFLLDAWLTLFSRWLPFVLLWDAFELIEAEGFPGVLCLTAALLEAHATALAEADDFTSLFVLLKALDKQPRQPQGRELLVAARALLPAAREVMADISDPDCKVRTFSTMSVMSVKRDGFKVIHEPSGLEILKEELHRDVENLAHAMSTSTTTHPPQKAEREQKINGELSHITDISGETTRSTTPSAAKGRRRIGCFPCRSGRQGAAARREA